MHCSQSLCPAVCMVPFHRKTADNLRLRSNRLCTRSHSRSGVCRLWKQSPTWAWLISHRPTIDSDYMRAADRQSRVTGCRVSVGGSSIHLTPRVSSVRRYSGNRRRLRERNVGWARAIGLGSELFVCWCALSLSRYDDVEGNVLRL